jgi:hypothetical protein
MNDTDSESEKIEQNKKWFNFYLDRLENHSIVEPSQNDVVYKCPCCGYKTLSERGGFEICPVCFWEDDGQDEQDADIVRGGPNRSLSLAQARANFHNFGACEKRFIKNVRKPLSEEI